MLEPLQLRAGMSETPTPNTGSPCWRVSRIWTSNQRRGSVLDPEGSDTQTFTLAVQVVGCEGASGIRVRVSMGTERDGGERVKSKTQRRYRVKISEPAQTPTPPHVPFASTTRHSASMAHQDAQSHRTYFFKQSNQMDSYSPYHPLHQVRTSSSRSYATCQLTAQREWGNPYKLHARHSQCRLYTPSLCLRCVALRSKVNTAPLPPHPGQYS